VRIQTPEHLTNIPVRHHLAEESMRDVLYYLTVLLLGVGIAWCLRSGSAGFVWWERRWIHRDREPVAYWVLMAISFVVFIYFVINGKHMPLR
jgi:4-amino-4-deoxy-L-arabinose transferase-like glycosyltransferase